MNVAQSPYKAGAFWSFPSAATPEGSEAYYTVRFAPTPTRHRLALAFTWNQELQQILAKASDPGVARLKLDWWREELARAKIGRPRHPLAHQLADWLSVWPDLTPWLDMLDGIEVRIRKLQPETTAEFNAQCQRLGGGLGWLLSATDHQPPQQQVGAAKDLAAYRTAVLDVRDLALHGGRQFCPLPQDALDAASLSPDRLHEARHQPTLARCLNDILGSYDRMLREARRIQSQGWRAVMPSARLGFQAGLLHRKLARAGYPVFREYVDLLPLRRLWSAWRLR